jgi:hypothetical protein
MASEILSSQLILLPLICVIVVVAYLLAQRKFWYDISDVHPSITIDILQSQSLMAKEITEQMPGSVRKYAGEHPRPDDSTLMVNHGV